MTTKKTTGTKKTTVRANAQGKKRATDKPSSRVAVTAAGISFTVDLNVFNDFEVVEYLDSLDRGVNPLRMAPLFRKLADEHADEVLDKLRDANGVVSVEAAQEVIVSILKQVEAANPNP